MGLGHREGMNAVEKELVRLQISDSWGFDVETLRAILRVLDADPPLQFAFHSPSPVVAYYEPRMSSVLKKRVIPALVRILQSQRSRLENSTLSLCPDRFKIDGDSITGTGAEETVVFEQREAKSP